MKKSLGDRMKKCYEDVSRIYLTRRIPVIIRADMKAGHSFVKRNKLEKPFDNRFVDMMLNAAKTLCSEIQGCKIAYIQSDEISLLLTDYDHIETDAWFGYNLQKLCSISASILTSSFNNNFYEIFGRCGDALFDSRAFNIPKEEVINYFHWRQVDAIRNSILGVAQKNFSHKDLQGKNTIELKKMLLDKKIIWEEMETHLKRGSCIIKQEYIINNVARKKWAKDMNVPIFIENIEYINNLL